MKQTAVKWLAEKYDYVYWMVKRDEISPALAEEWKKHYLEQAKEMENERVTEAYRIGRIGKSIKEFNETFKSE